MLLFAELHPLHPLHPSLDRDLDGSIRCDLFLAFAVRCSWERLLRPACDARVGNRSYRSISSPDRSIYIDRHLQSIDRRQSAIKSSMLVFVVTIYGDPTHQLKNLPPIIPFKETKRKSRLINTGFAPGTKALSHGHNMPP